MFCHPSETGRIRFRGVRFQTPSSVTQWTFRIFLGTPRPGTEVSRALRARNPKRVRKGVPGPPAPGRPFGPFSDSFGVPGPKGPGDLGSVPGRGVPKGGGEGGVRGDTEAGGGVRFLIENPRRGGGGSPMRGGRVSAETWCGGG